MKTEFGNRPPEFAVDKIGEQAQVTFFTGIEQLPPREDGGERWQADTLTLTVPWRNGLDQAVGDNLSAWLAMAQGQAGMQPPTTIKDRVGAVESKTATLEETLDVLFGGTV